MRLAETPDFLQSVMEQRWHWVARDGTPKGQLADIFDRCVSLECEDGGAVFVPLGGGVYDAHVMFKPKAKDVRAKCREAIRLMFSLTDCREIVGRIASDNKAALRLVRALGFQHTHTSPASFVRGGVAHDTLHYTLRKATEGRANVHW